MDENFNPNRVTDGSNGSDNVTFQEKAGNSNCRGKAVADVDAPLREVIGALEDGRLAVVGDLVAIRAGPETYHPIKALKVIPEVARSLTTEYSAVGLLRSTSQTQIEDTDV